MNDSNNEKIVKELSQAWMNAQRQLAELRSKVEYMSHFAETKAQGDSLQNDLDQAYQNLGKAVFDACMEGNLAIPPKLQPAMTALASVQSAVAQHKQEVAELLAEGAEVASRLNEKP